MRPVPSTWYHCDNKFHVEVMADLMDDGHKYGFIIMDGNGCLFGTVRGNSRNVVHRFTVDLPKKHGRGGQSALRFARLRLEKRHNYLKKVAEKAEELWVVGGECLLAGLVLAGSADFKDQLQQSAVFSPVLQQKVLKVLDIAHGGLVGFDEAIGLSADTLAGVKLVEEKQLIGKFFEQIRLENGKYCFGTEETMKLLEMGAIETLICWEDFDGQRIKVTGQDGEESVTYVLKPQPVKEKLNAGDGVHIQMEVHPLLHWLTEHYMEYGVRLEIVSDKTQEGAQFVHGFGGFGGILRYKVDMVDFPDPCDDSENGSGFDYEKA